MKENVSGCFFLNTVYIAHIVRKPLMRWSHTIATGQQLKRIVFSELIADVIWKLKHLLSFYVRVPHKQCPEVIFEVDFWCICEGWNDLWELLVTISLLVIGNLRELCLLYASRVHQGSLCYSIGSTENIISYLGHCSVCLSVCISVSCILLLLPPWWWINVNSWGAINRKTTSAAIQTRRRLFVTQSTMQTVYRVLGGYDYATRISASLKSYISSNIDNRYAIHRLVTPLQRYIFRRSVLHWIRNIVQRHLTSCTAVNFRTDLYELFRDKANKLRQEYWLEITNVGHRCCSQRNRAMLRQESRRLSANLGFSLEKN